MAVLMPWQPSQSYVRNEQYSAMLGLARLYYLIHGRNRALFLLAVSGLAE